MSQIDVFSYGILVCEMFICELPDKDKMEREMGRIENNRIKNVVKDCTAKDPQERLTMAQVINLWQQIE